MTTRPLIPCACACACALSLLAPLSGAQAQMPVYDGANYAQMMQSVSQGVRQLQSLQVQVQQQAAMLARLQQNFSKPLSAVNQANAQTLGQAVGIGYAAGDIAASFSSAYPTSLPGARSAQITASLANWRSRSRQTLEEAMGAQITVAGAQPTTAQSVTAAVAASQSAPGQTAAIQSTNQILAALSVQLSQLQTLMMTAARAAQSSAAEQQSLPAAAAAESARALQYAPPPSRLQLSGQL